MLDCKHALEEAGGEFEKAKEILRQKGHALAAKRAERATAEGVVLSYLHHDGRLGALVEINCESDFVARTEDFPQLAPLPQPFARDESVSIQDMVNEAIRKTGENIRVRRFARFELGR